MEYHFQQSCIRAGYTYAFDGEKLYNVAIRKNKMLETQEYLSELKRLENEICEIQADENLEYKVTKKAKLYSTNKAHDSKLDKFYLFLCELDSSIYLPLYEYETNKLNFTYCKTVAQHFYPYYTKSAFDAEYHEKVNDLANEIYEKLKFANGKINPVVENELYKAYNALQQADIHYICQFLVDYNIIAEKDIEAYIEANKSEHFF